MYIAVWILDYILDVVNIILWIPWILLYSSKGGIFKFCCICWFFAIVNLVWLKLQALSFGQLLLAQLSSFMFSWAAWSLPTKAQLRAQPETWTEFIQRIWGCVSLSVPSKILPHFPGTVVTLISALWFLRPERLSFLSEFSYPTGSWLLKAVKIGTYPVPSVDSPPEFAGLSHSPVSLGSVVKILPRIDSYL